MMLKMGETLSEEEVGRMMTQADQVLGVGASALNKNFLTADEPF